MNSRADKYYDKNTVGSRTERNNQLYKEISNTEVDGYEIKSNATVIGNNSNNIDVEKIKSILDTHYNDTPRRRTIPIENEDKEQEGKKELETKEYDINVILDKAKEDNTSSYEEDRSKKLHNTQFNILNELNINREDYIEDYDDDSKTASAERKLQELINTINLNEKDLAKAKKKIINQSDSKDQIANANKKELTDPLDIFEELKGDENTAILDGLQEKTEKLMDKIEKTTSLDNTFFTKSNQIKSKDFEDFRDIEEDGPSGIVKVIIGILIITFIIGIVILIKTLI